MLQEMGNVFACLMMCRSLESTWRSTARGSGTSRGLGARRSGCRVKSRVIHTVHVERQEAQTVSRLSLKTVGVMKTAC